MKRITILLMVIICLLIFTYQVKAEGTVSDSASVSFGKWVVGFLNVNLGIINGLEEGMQGDRFNVKTDIFLGAGKDFGIVNKIWGVGLFGTVRFYSGTEKKFSPLLGIGFLFKDVGIIGGIDFNESYLESGSYFQKHFRVLLSGNLK